jgi:hypothetical protein
MGGGAIARVVGRLATTGLIRWHDDLAPGMFKKLDGRETNLGSHEIDETGDK